MADRPSIYVGWDVGGWNCDRNPTSRDALIVLEEVEGTLEVVGDPFWGNVRDLLNHAEGDAVLWGMIGRAGVPRRRGWSAVVAIDAPLAWPRSVLEMLVTGDTTSVPPQAEKNPYLFRDQERALFVDRRGPLSVVRDLLGSQSTKAIHFLRRAKLEERTSGIWTSRVGAITAIETYPARVLLDVKLRTLVRQLSYAVTRSRGSRGWRNDVRDAIACAVVARTFHRDRQRLVEPFGLDPGRRSEGWIWLPQPQGAESK